MHSNFKSGGCKKYAIRHGKNSRIVDTVIIGQDALYLVDAVLDIKMAQRSRLDCSLLLGSGSEEMSALHLANLFDVKCANIGSP